MTVDHKNLKLTALLLFTALAGVIFVMFYSFAGGRFPGGHHYKASALVPEAFNLVPRSDVRASGVKIGEVRSLHSDGQVSRVTFEIDKKYAPLYRDATVRVRTKTLVGETYLEVDPGTRTSGALPSGSVIPLSAAAESVPLEKILNTLDPATRREVRRTMAGLGDGLSGHGQQLNDLFAAVRPTAVDGGRLMQELAPQGRQVAALLDQTGQVMSAFAARTADVQSLARSAKATAVAVARRDGRLRESFRQLPATLDRARTAVAHLGAFSARATPVVDDLVAASGDLTPALRDLGPTAHAGRALFRRLRPFLTAIDPTVSRLGPAAKAVKGVIPGLDTNLRNIDPALGYLKPFSREFGSFFANVGAAADTTDALGHVVRVHAIAGPDQFLNMPAGVISAEKAFIKAGALEKIYNPMANPYPEAGAVAHPSEARAFGSQYPRLAPRPAR